MDRLSYVILQVCTLVIMNAGGWVDFFKIKIQIGTRITRYQFEFGGGGSYFLDSQNYIKKGYRFIPQILPTDMYIVCVPHSHHKVCLSWSSIMFIFPSSEYDVNKIIEYPGFTVPLPLGFIDVSFTLCPLFHSVFDFSVKFVAFFSELCEIWTIMK